MVTTMLAIGACLLLLIAAAWTSAKQEDSNLKKLLDEINFEKAERSKLQKQVNEMNDRLYVVHESMNKFMMENDKHTLEFNKKLRDLEFYAMKPKAINVTLMKPVEISTPSPLKVMAGVSTKSHNAAPKKKTIKKVSKKKSLRKSKSK